MMKKLVFVAALALLSVIGRAQGIGVYILDYGGDRLSLRKTPSANSEAVFSFTDERQLRVLDVKGDWVKVRTLDGKHTGWIEAEWLCGNSLTNCC